MGKGLGIGINGDFRRRAVPDRLGFARAFSDISHGAFGKPLFAVWPRSFAAPPRCMTQLEN
jgi:hypothetical protein